MNIFHVLFTVPTRAGLEQNGLRWPLGDVRGVCRYYMNEVVPELVNSNVCRVSVSYFESVFNCWKYVWNYFKLKPIFWIVKRELKKEVKICSTILEISPYHQWDFTTVLSGGFFKQKSSEGGSSWSYKYTNTTQVDVHTIIIMLIVVVVFVFRHFFYREFPAE